MQTKHLHALLLIFLLAGCGGQKPSPDNLFITGKEPVALIFPAAGSVPTLLFGDLDVAAAHSPDSDDPFVIQMHPRTNGRWLGGLQVDGFDRDKSVVSRTLSSLLIEDTSSGWRYAASALPNGSGVAFYLEGEVYTDVRFNLAPTPKDTLFLHAFKTGAIETYQLPDSSYLALAASPTFRDEVSATGIGFGLHRPLNDGKRRQVVLAFASLQDEAEKLAMTYRGMTRAKLERAARDSLSHHAAFSLNTEDDRTNEAFALLSAALVKAGERMSWRTPREIQDAASAARGLFLASQERPAKIWGPSNPDTPRRVNWGSEAYRAVLSYGMGDDDSLKHASLAVLTGVTQLNREYASDLFAIGDDEIPDTLQRLAEGHIRFAELQTFCGDISVARGDREAEGNFRREALRASKNARRFFREAGTQYRQMHGTHDFADLFDVTESSDPNDSEDVALTVPETAPAQPPDTLRYLRTGAHYGFNWLAPRPVELVRGSMDGFTWLKWTAQRFADDLKITQTPDLDSLLTLLLSGPLPGALTNDPGHGGEPSLPVMAAAFENLSELYLGVQPNWIQHRVDVLPRPPQRWGHTAARVPIGPGFLDLDYDFENASVSIGMTGIERQLDVFFGYPLPTGAFARTQFALSPDEPRERIKMTRDADNRVKLDVNPE